LHHRAWQCRNAPGYHKFDETRDSGGQLEKLLRTQLYPSPGLVPRSCGHWQVLGQKWTLYMISAMLKWIVTVEKRTFRRYFKLQQALHIHRRIGGNPLYHLDFATPWLRAVRTDETQMGDQEASLVNIRDAARAECRVHFREVDL
jgi:hypothetical protein